MLHLHQFVLEFYIILLFSWLRIAISVSSILFLDCANFNAIYASSSFFEAIFNLLYSSFNLLFAASLARLFVAIYSARLFACSARLDGLFACLVAWFAAVYSDSLANQAVGCQLAVFLLLDWLLLLGCLDWLLLLGCLDCLLDWLDCLLDCLIDWLIDWSIDYCCSIEFFI